MAKPAWGAKSAWADAVEEEGTGEMAPLPPLPLPDFPTLESAAEAAKKGKKKKATKLSLSEFATLDASGKFRPSAARMAAAGGGGPALMSRHDRDDDIDLSMLPKGPSSKPDEDAGGPGLGGAFKDYGGYRGGGRDEEDDRRRPRDEDMPSRADEDSNWGGNKKALPAGGPYNRRDDAGRGRDDMGRENEEDAGPSRADEDSNWGASKKFVPGPGRVSPGRSRSRSPGPGLGGPSRADEDSNWGSSKKFVPSTRPTERPPGGGFADRYQDRPTVDRPSEGERWGRRGPPDALPERGRGMERGMERGPPPPTSERPRLNLKPRSLPLPEQAAASPTIASPNKPSSENGEQQPPSHAAPAEAQAPKPKPNPFGGARPREEVVKERAVANPIADIRPLEEALKQQGLEDAGAPAPRDEAVKEVEDTSEEVSASA
eukprot:jgi/Chlat1/6600/Chrsp46S06096